jgi:DNA polymerase-1
MTDWKQFWQYNATDAAVTLESWFLLEKELRESNCFPSYEFNLSLIEPLTYLSLRGFRLAESGMRQLSRELEDEYRELQKKLLELTEVELNPHSPKQLQTYFYVDKNEKPYISRTTGKMTVDEEALNRLARKGYKEAQVIIRMREIRKLKSSYLDVQYDEDGRMRCSYNPAGTSTGRLSSSKTIFGKGLNLQTVPKQARVFFVADEDHLIVEIDLSQAEARVVAYLASDPQMMQVFENGEDIHTLTATLMKTDRQTAKTINHASNYAMGPEKLGLLLGISRKEAEVLRESYHAIYPGIRSVFHKGVEEQMRSKHFLVNLFGRRRLFMEQWDEELLRAGYAYIPQSTVAELTNRGLLRIYQTGKYDLLAQVHDSVVLQVKKSTTLRELKELKGLMEETLEYKSRSFVIPAEVKIGPNWRDLEAVRF